MVCIHTFENTASEMYMKCSKCNAVCKSKCGVPLEIIKPTRKKRMTWHEAEREMLEMSHPVSLVDYAKAERDLRNYWK